MVQKHTFSLMSFVRNNRKNLDGESAVYLRITVVPPACIGNIYVCSGQAAAEENIPVVRRSLYPGELPAEIDLRTRIIERGAR